MHFVVQFVLLTVNVLALSFLFSIVFDSVTHVFVCLCTQLEEVKDALFTAKTRCVIYGIQPRAVQVCVM